jgi:uncharacterized phiE125 gp8 family phage protein
VLKIVTAAADEPISLEEAKLFLRVDTDADDTLIAALIAAAREYAEHYTQATFATTEYELALDAFPVDAIGLPKAASPAVESIKYLDTAREEQTLDPAAYVLSEYGMEPFIYPLQAWPATGAYPNAVRIRYTANAATISAAARAAMLEMIAYLYERREDAAAVPPGVMRLLDVVKAYL